MKRASVSVDGEVAGEIGSGLLVLVGVGAVDTEADVDRAAEKVVHLRVFADDVGHMNRSLVETGGSALVVSQFTLLADVRKGRRPSFTDAAAPDRAKPLIDRFVSALSGAGVSTETGVFGAAMQVELVNDGPVTIVFEVSGGQVS